MNFLAAPHRVANKLDWKVRASPGAAAAAVGNTSSKLQNVLALDICRDRISMVVAPHPLTRKPVQTLPPLRLERICHGNDDKNNNHSSTSKRVTLTQNCVDRMAQVVKDYQVCALLVSWPLQKEGRFGKPCGTVLHTLDAMLEKSNTIVTHQRPVCLWNDRHVRLPLNDRWGRDPIYGRKCTNTRTEYRASQEQYLHHHNHQHCAETDMNDRNESIAAVHVWQDFCQTHWPDIVQKPHAGCDSDSNNTKYLSVVKNENKDERIPKRPMQISVGIDDDDDGDKIASCA